MIKWIKKTAIRPLLAYIPAMQYRRSYAYDHLDQRLEPFLIKKHGFFVEAGAHNGLWMSNTFYFERYLGWKGLLIEPIPKLVEQCRINRPNCHVEHAALVSDAFDEERVTMHSCGVTSTTEGAFGDRKLMEQHLEAGSKFLQPGETMEVVDVPARTLTSIFDQYDVPSIDLLSLDIEGYEPEALKGLDFERYGPQYLLIEVRNRQSIEEVLPDNYSMIAVLSINPYYEDILYARQN